MTDQERLDAALERAAEMVAVCEPMYIAGFPQGNEAVTQVMPNALEGWAAAIRALLIWHPGWSVPCHTKVGCSACEAIFSFIKVMLG